MKSVYSGVHAQGLDDAKATTEKMNAGNFDPTHPANAEELAHWTSVMFRNDPSKLLNPSLLDPAGATKAMYGQPTEGAGIADAVEGAKNQVGDYGVAAAKTGLAQSVSEGVGPEKTGGNALSKSMWAQGAQDLHQGLSSNDPKQLASGFQALYGPQIEAGRLGYLDQLGGQVTSAVINPDKPFVPTPDGKKAMPVLSMTGQLPDGSTTQQEYAPPTQGGFHHDDNQDLHALDPAKTFDYLGQQGVAHSIIQHPLVQNNLADYMKNPSDKVKDWAAAYTALGAGDGLVTKQENIGGKYQAVSYTKDGKVVRSTEIPGSMPTSEYAAREQALRDEVAAGRMTEQEAKQARINGIQKPAAGGGKEDVAGQRFTIGLNLLKDQLHNGEFGPGAAGQAEYNRQLALFVGLGGKPGNDLPAAKNRGVLADEKTHLDEGEYKDPSLGWVKATKPDQLESLRVARLAFKNKQQAEGVSQPGIGAPAVHDVPGTSDAADAAPPSPPTPVPMAAGKVDLSKLQVGTVYLGPKGLPGKWDGTHFVAVPAPAGK